MATGEDKPLALIVKDHEDAAIILANAMQEAGFEIEIVRAGDAASSGWPMLNIPVRCTCRDL